MRRIQAFKDHKIVDPFYRPGQCDLTVNVDFAYLKEASADLGQMTCYLKCATQISDISCRHVATHHGPLSQAIFLHRMGLQPRLDALKAAAKDEERRKQIDQAAKRLVDPTGMGTQYQVMGMTGKTKKVLTDEERWPFIEAVQHPESADVGQQPSTV